MVESETETGENWKVEAKAEYFCTKYDASLFLIATFFFRGQGIIQFRIIFTTFPRDNFQLR